MPTFEKWQWIELIGFDNEQRDYGVAAYLETTGFLPKAISLLLYSPDFVHLHEDMAEERALPVEVCSYRARPYGRERARQNWTNYELRGLIGELQQRGIAVYCSFFNMFKYMLDGQTRSGVWSGEHPELYETSRTGASLGVLNPLRRMADGSYYEDFFVARLTRALADYGFDGYHGADGYTSPRYCLAEADYSDDMVYQFANASGVSLPERLSSPCEDDTERKAERAEWIWTNKRLEWIAFYADRFAEFWGKVVSALHRDGKKVAFNSAWTRDPFEALFRYGIDYARIAATGMDAFVVETGAVALTVGGAGVEYDPRDEFCAMLMLIKAYVPGIKLICLNTIQDTTERWDALRHAPAALERDIYALANVYYFDGHEGRPIRCSSGFMACLSDGIRRDEWSWIRGRWEIGFARQPERLIGAAFIWSDRALAAELAQYVVGRNYSGHKWLHELISRGAPVYGTVRVGNLDSMRGPVMAANVHLWPKEELDCLLRYEHGPVIMIGTMTESFALNVPVMRNKVGRDRLFCAVYDADKSVNIRIVTEQPPDATDPLHSSNTIDDAISWIKGLTFTSVSDRFLRACATAIVASTGSPFVADGSEWITVNTLAVGGTRRRLIIANADFTYKTALIDMGSPIAYVEICTDFPGMPIVPDGSRFRTVVPGKGIVIVEVAYA
jgi:hypothetical protein